jgi:hypothetical protein
MEERRVQIRTMSATTERPFIREEEIDRMIRKLQAEGEKIVEVMIRRPSLEEVYFRAVGRSENELV